MPRRRRGETEDAFVSRCVPIVIREGTAENNEQAVAICHSMFADQRGNEMSNNMLCLNFKANNYSPRTEQLRGRDHIVVPVAMLTEGVFTGLDGIPTYYPSDTLQQMPYAWNGMPVTITHPLEGDQTVSARAPEIMERYNVGTLFNVGWYDNKLRGELWIDIVLAQQIYPALLEMIKRGDDIEVSTGLFPIEEITAGEFAGREYERIMRGMMPDHLALLPESEGACNFGDGCGVRANEMKGGDTVEFKGVEFDSLSVSFDKEGTPVVSNETDALPFDLLAYLQFEKIADVEGLETSFEEIRSALQKEVDKLDNSQYLHYVKGVFSGTFVYEASAQSPMGQTKLYRQEYNVAENGSVEITGDPIEVRQKTEYVPVSNETINNETKEVEEMSDKCCKEKIDSLIQNESTPYTEEDMKWLEAQDEEQIDKLITLAEMATETPESEEGTPPDSEGKEIPAANEEETPQTLEEFIDTAPDGEMKEMLLSGLVLHRQKKAGLVVSLMKAEGNKFSKEQLEGKDIGELEGLVSLAKVGVDYSGRGGAQQTDNESEPMPITAEHGAA